MAFEKNVGLTRPSRQLLLKLTELALAESLQHLRLFAKPVSIKHKQHFMVLH